MKPSPGYTSTEFWTTLLMNVIAILTLFGVHLSSSSSQYTQAIAVLAAGIATAIYTHSRQQVKVASINSAPPAQTTLIMRPTTTTNPSDATTQTTVTQPATDTATMPSV